MRASPPRSMREARHLPALDVNVDLLERRTALRTLFNSLHGPTGRAILADNDGISSAADSITEDATDASASFHSGSFTDDLEADRQIPLTLPTTSTSTTWSCFGLDAQSSPTSTTTTGATPSRRSGGRRHTSPGPRASNVVSTEAQVEDATLRVFAACAQCRPLQCAVFPSMRLETLLAHFTEQFVVMGILPDAAKWLLSARTHWLHDGDLAVFLLTGWGTLEPEFVSVWIEPGHRWPTPFVSSVPNYASRRQLLSTISLPDTEHLVITIDGILWDGQARFFHNGQVVQLRSTWHRLGTLPTHLMEDRILGLVALHFECHGPVGIREASSSTAQRRSLIQRHFTQCLAPFMENFAPSDAFNSIYLIIQCGPVLHVSLGTRLPPAVDDVQLFFDEHFARTTAPAGKVWYPGEVAGNLGIAFLQAIAQVSECQAPARLSSISATPPVSTATRVETDSEVSFTHSVHSIFGSSPSNGYSSVSNVEAELRELLHQGNDSAVPSPSDNASATSSPDIPQPNTSGNDASSESSSSSSSSSSSAVLLQHKTVVHPRVLHGIPTPTRSEKAKVLEADHVPLWGTISPCAPVLSQERKAFCTFSPLVRLRIWTDDDVCEITCQASAGTLDVERALQQQLGRCISAASLVPLFPQPVDDQAFVCLVAQDPSTRTTVLVTPPGGRRPVVCHLAGRAAPADICAMVGCKPSALACNQQLWQGDVDGLFQGMHFKVMDGPSNGDAKVKFPIHLNYLVDDRFEQGSLLAHQLREAVCRAAAARWALTADLTVCEHFLEKGTAPFSTCHNPRARSQGARSVHVFTDGSAIAAGPQERVGSAFTVWHGRADYELMQGCFAHSLGCIHDHGNDGPFIAECHALRLALGWIFSQPAHVPVIVHFDSLRAGLAANGEWNISGASEYAKRVCCSVRAMALMLAQTHDVQFQHVKAHDGCIPNVLADAFAKAAAYGRCSMHVPDAVLHFFQARDLEWAWLSLRCDPSLPAVEAVLGRKVFAPSPSNLEELAAGVADVGVLSAGSAVSPAIQFQDVLIDLSMLIGLSVLIGCSVLGY